MKCAGCEHLLRGEKQKTYVYYRCHSKACPGNCVREDRVDEALQLTLGPLTLASEEWRYLARKLPGLNDDEKEECKKTAAALELRHADVKERVTRLTDALIDRLIEKEVYEDRKAALLMEQQEIEERQRDLNAGRTLAEKLAELVELAGNAYFLYELASDAEKRDLLKILGSNFQVIRKNVDFTLFPPFQLIANRRNSSQGGPSADSGRTWDEILGRLVIIIRDTPLELFERITEFLSRRKEDPAPLLNASTKPPSTTGITRLPCSDAHLDPDWDGGFF